MENHHFLIGKPSINGPFSMAMLNNQRVRVKNTHQWLCCSLGKNYEKLGSIIRINTRISGMFQFEEQLWETWYTIDCLSVSKNCRIL